MTSQTYFSFQRRKNKEGTKNKRGKEPWFEGLKRKYINSWTEQKRTHQVPHHGHKRQYEKLSKQRFHKKISQFIKIKMNNRVRRGQKLVKSGFQININRKAAAGTLMSKNADDLLMTSLYVNLILGCSEFRQLREILIWSGE